MFDWFKTKRETENLRKQNFDDLLQLVEDYKKFVKELQEKNDEKHKQILELTKAACEWKHVAIVASQQRDQLLEAIKNRGYDA